MLPDWPSGSTHGIGMRLNGADIGSKWNLSVNLKDAYIDVQASPSEVAQGGGGLLDTYTLVSVDASNTHYVANGGMVTDYSTIILYPKTGQALWTRAFPFSEMAFTYFLQCQ